MLFVPVVGLLVMGASYQADDPSWDDPSSVAVESHFDAADDFLPLADTTTVCDALGDGEMAPDTCVLLTSQERQALIDVFEMGAFRNDHPNCLALSMHLSDMATDESALARGTHSGGYAGLTAIDEGVETFGVWFHDDIVDGTAAGITRLKVIIHEMVHAMHSSSDEGMADAAAQYCSGSTQILPDGWPQPD